MGNFDPMLLLNYAGSYGPYFLMVVSAVLLFSKPEFLGFMIVGQAFNSLLNMTLKNLIQEPRPSNDRKELEICIVNGHRLPFDKYGMPSGHAQTIMYLLVYTTLVLNNTFIFAMYALLAANTIRHRYTGENHTIGQLLVGIAVGCGVGAGTYLVATNHIRGKISTKQEENAPI